MLKTREVYLLTLSRFLWKSSTSPSGIVGLSFNHQLTCGFPVTDFWNHRKPRFAVSPGQVVMTHSRQGTRQTNKQTKVALLFTLTGWPWAFYLKPVSINKAHAHTRADCALWNHPLSKDSLLCQPTGLSRFHNSLGWGLTLELNATSFQTLQIGKPYPIQLAWTNHSFLSRSSLDHIFITAKIHYKGN